MEKGKLKDLIKKNYMIVDSNCFFEYLKDSSLLKFRKNIQMLQELVPSIFLEQKVLNYYNSLLQEFDTETSLFKEYRDILALVENNNLEELYHGYEFNYLVDEKMIIQLQDYCHHYDKFEKAYSYLKKTTNQKVSEIVVDGLFGDTIYNVWINIKEMLRFNDNLSQHEKILSKERIKFYLTILEIDKMDCQDKIKLYYELIDKRIDLMFYEDLRRIKDFSYQKIKEQLFGLDANSEKFNLNDSSLYNTPIYDLYGEKFYMLVRCMREFSKETDSRRNCYTAISDYNMEVFSEKDFIYGYKNIEISHILHMFEQDAYSSCYNSASSIIIKYPNRIVTLDQIIEECGYNEIQIVNPKSNKDDKYTALCPDFLVVFDYITEKHVKEAKRLGIPIVRIIKSSYLNRKPKTDSIKGYEKTYHDYTDGSYKEEDRLVKRLYKC